MRARRAYGRAPPQQVASLRDVRARRAYGRAAAKSHLPRRHVEVARSERDLEASRVAQLARHRVSDHTQLGRALEPPGRLGLHPHRLGFVILMDALHAKGHGHEVVALVQLALLRHEDVVARRQRQVGAWRHKLGVVQLKLL
eukprot:6386001-Prymnesium_polylepis.1